MDHTPLENALISISPARNGIGGYIASQNAFSLSHLTSSHVSQLRSMDQVVSKNEFVASLLADAAGTIPKAIQKNNHFSSWVSGFADFGAGAAANQNPSFNFTSEAALVGFDYRVSRKGLVGLSLGYLHSHFHEEKQAGQGTLNGGFLSLYGSASIDRFYFEPAVWVILNQIVNERQIAFPGFSENAESTIHAWQLVPHLEVGYDFGTQWGDLIPFVSVDYAANWQRGYTETGASPYNATQGSHYTSMIRSEGGLKFCETWVFDWGMFFIKEKASYIFEKPFGSGVTTFLTGTPTTFSVTSFNQNLNLGSIGLECFASIGHDSPIGISVSYEGEFGSNYVSNEATLNVSKCF